MNHQPRSIAHALRLNPEIEDLWYREADSWVVREADYVCHEVLDKIDGSLVKISVQRALSEQ